MSCEMVKLGEVCEFIRNGASIKQGEVSGGYPITRIETIADGNINENKVGYAGIFDKEKYLDWFLNDGDILISHINSEKHLGKSAIYFGKENKLIHGMNLLCFRSKKEKLYSKFANYFFKSLYFKLQIPKISKKSVNQASFSVKDIKNLKIPLPSLDTQVKIANALDKAQELIDKRKEQIAQMDEFLQSLFLDMFGDPVTNPKGWEVKELGELCEFITKGTTPKSNLIFEKYEKGLIPFIKVYQIMNDGSVDLNYKPYYISEETNLKYNRSKVFNGDILMNIVGPPLGKIGLLQSEFEECNINQAIAFFRTKESLNNRYLLYLLKYPTMLTYIISIAIGIRQLNISLKQCRELKISLPPLDLQKKFASIVEKTEAEKEKLQKGLEEMENNFNSMMQKAFRGELF